MILPNVPKKLHEIEKILGRRGRAGVRSATVVVINLILLSDFNWLVHMALLNCSDFFDIQF